MQLLLAAVRRWSLPCPPHVSACIPLIAGVLSRCSVARHAVEIDRTLKKVEEGVELYDTVFEKVYSASTQTQKEKFEGDLKKEIKRLQRYRDQIKSWISNSDVKQKQPLMDARRVCPPCPHTLRCRSHSLRFDSPDS